MKPFHYDSRLSDDQAKETVQNSKFLTEKGAEIKHEESWGLKKLVIYSENYEFYTV